MRLRGGTGFVIHTDPGCGSEMHRLEVAGVMMALAEVGPWAGRTLMDCGCLLWVEDPDQ